MPDGTDRSQDGAPADPIPAMSAEAVTFHTIYTTYVDVGFSPSQALYLTGALLVEAVRRAPG